MNTLKFETKWFPSNSEESGKALRVVNISNTSGIVKVTGGNASIYGEPTRSNDINKLQFKRKGAGSWQAVPSTGSQLSCAVGGYIDFRYKHIDGQNIEMNNGLSEDFVKISSNMNAELSGELDALQLDPTTGTDKFHSLFSFCPNYIHASALILPSNIGDQDYCQMFESCVNLRTPPNASGFAENVEVKAKSFAFMFKNCASLTAGMDLAPSSYIGTQACKEMYWQCYSLPHPAHMAIKTIGANQAQFMKMYAGCTGMTTSYGISFQTNYVSIDCCNSMFSGCSNLQDFPALPAMNLSRQCYYSMFEDCEDLNDTISLPATEVADEAYRNMFLGCESLETAPNFSHVTIVHDQCFEQMFDGCIKLQATFVDFGQIVEVTGVRDFQAMFRQCHAFNPISITLPAVTQITGVTMFNEMFADCSSLVKPPTLPYTSISENCYKAMFKNCTSLSTAPDLLIQERANLGLNCYQDMFSGCTSLHYLNNQQRDWFTLNDTLVTKNWVANVPYQGDYYCHPDIANNPDKLIYDFSHIPFSDNEGYRWTIHAVEQAAPFTRYQDKTTSLKSQWNDLSAYTNNELVTDFGFYRNNSVNHILGTGDNETIIIHFSQKGNGGSVPYPWVSPNFYTVTTQLGATTINGISNIAMDNNNHCFTFTQYLSEGIYPDTNLSGLYNPVQLSCVYTNGDETSSKIINFVFVCDEETTSNIDTNVLLLGGTGAGDITIENIPTSPESFVMIKKFNKSTGQSTTDWCDVTGYNKVVVPVAATEWLGVKNGAMDLQIKTVSNTNYVVDNGSTDKNIHIKTSNSTGGIISGNIKGLGSPYFECADTYNFDNGTETRSINVWGNSICKGMFSGSTFQTISQYLFYDCNFWNAPSGCYRMFYNCDTLTCTLNIYDNNGQNYWDDYMFHQMFRDAYLNNIITNTIECPNTVFSDYAAYKMFYGTSIKGYSFNGPLNSRSGKEIYRYVKGNSTIQVSNDEQASGAFQEMFANCKKLLADYTDSFEVGNVGKFTFANMFSGCTGLQYFYGDFNWDGSHVTSLSEGHDGCFSGIFKDCTNLYTFTFTNAYRWFELESQYFASMFEGCTGLASVYGLSCTLGSNRACYKMFYGCTSLNIADVYISGSAGTYQYAQMFSGCTSLPRVSLLTIEGTSEKCCYEMFCECGSFSNNNNKINITNKVTYGCYQNMFRDCSSLIISPNVIEPSPITQYNSTLNTDNAFNYMFAGCSNMTDFNLKNLVYYYNVPTHAYSTFAGMFSGCTKLNFSCTNQYYYGMGDENMIDYNELPIINCAGDAGTVGSMFQGCTSLEYTPIMLCVNNQERYGDCFACTFYGCSSLKEAIMIFSPKEISNHGSNDMVGPFGDNTWTNVPSDLKFITNVDNQYMFDFKAQNADPDHCNWTQTYDGRWNSVIQWSYIGQN